MSVCRGKEGRGAQAVSRGILFLLLLLVRFRCRGPEWDEAQAGRRSKDFVFVGFSWYPCVVPRSGTTLKPECAEKG